jgi:hypothetical protein
MRIWEYFENAVTLVTYIDYMKGSRHNLSFRFYTLLTEQECGAKLRATLRENSQMFKLH